MTRDRLHFLFNRYVSQTISEAEKKELFDLVADAQSDKSLKDLIDQLWDSLPEENVHISIPEKVFKNVINQPSGKLARNSIRNFSFLKFAAAIGIIAIGSVAIYFSPLSNSTQSIASADFVDSSNRNSFVRLPDGSTVLLNDKSTLKYEKSFGDVTREVQLEGEAFFDIKHNPSKPFIVRSGNVSTTVLGTAFNVKAFPADKEVIVTVTRGKVEVSENKKVLGIITSDQQIAVSKNAVTTVEKISNKQEVLAWMERDIFFDDIRMEEAIQELEHRFDVKIHLLNDQIKNCRFTATFVKGEDLDQILLVICEFNQASFHRMSSGNIIEIDGAGCQ